MGFSIDTDKYYVYDNAWWWGTSCPIIRKDGAGMVEVQFDSTMPETMYIKGLRVMRDNRRQGIATELISLCESIGKQSNMAFIRLSVEKDKKWLFEWYKRLGFHVLFIEDNVYELIKAI